MDCKVISGSETRFNLSPIPSQSAQFSLLKSLPPHLSFNTHLKKPSFSIKTSSGSYRIRAKAAVNSLYATAPSTESFYDLLGISESGTLSEIKRAYKQMALKYHPDVSPPDRTEEHTRRFIRVQEAYQTLSDPQTRAMYDSDMAKGLHLAFSGRRGVQFDERWEEKGGWKDRWRFQIMELKKRSMMNNKVDSRGRVSWAARIRRQRSEPFPSGF